MPADSIDAIRWGERSILLFDKLASLPAGRLTIADDVIHRSSALNDGHLTDCGVRALLTAIVRPPN
jgi:hypothetical protein